MPILSLLLRSLFSGLLILSLAGAPAPALAAATYTVNTLADNVTNGDGFCTLREAVLAANNAASNDCGTGSAAADTINIPVTGTLRLNATLPAITGSGGRLTLNGNTQFTLSGDSDGNNTPDVRLLIVESGADLTLQNLTLSRGKAHENYSGLLIGGAVVSQGTLAATNVTFERNSADYGGAVYTDGSATLNNCWFMYNQAVVSGGAVDNAGTAVINASSFFSSAAIEAGGALLNFGNLTVSKSTFFDGTAKWGAGIYNDNTLMLSDAFFNNDYADIHGGGIYHANGSLTVTRTTFSGEHATGSSGGAIYNAANAGVINSTFSNNSSTDSGAGVYNAGVLTVTNSTFADNYAILGGAGIHNTGDLTLVNTILTNGGAIDCISSGGTLTAHHNLLQDSGANACGLTHNLNNNLTGQNAMLEPFGANDAGMLYPLKPKSPAIDAGDNTACPATDQRGMIRPLDGNIDGSAVCDLGAYESAIQVYLPLLVK
ncbi:MAG TPA: choice-of-anchor Q domain-containing protein [Anaerolineaceae bacterium]|nr:choice-of-anchor Q domain-containing protein [Anaerolineaceae bacterium]HPN51873.1 choice-of-anchor Q domain-containing protein [Anaerolineaceae bacterium]